MANRLNLGVSPKRIGLAMSFLFLPLKDLMRAAYERIWEVDLHMTGSLLVQRIEHFPWCGWRDGPDFGATEHLDNHLAALVSDICIIPLQSIEGSRFHPGGGKADQGYAVLKREEQNLFRRLRIQHQVVDHSPQHLDTFPQIFQGHGQLFGVADFLHFHDETKVTGRPLGGFDATVILFRVVEYAKRFGAGEQTA